MRAERRAVLMVTEKDYLTVGQMVKLTAVLMEESWVAMMAALSAVPMDTLKVVSKAMKWVVM